jgi:hypothetical protein
MSGRDTLNRRLHERFRLPPMYTRVEVSRGAGLRLERLSGHAYDLSEGGLRIELDEPLVPGEVVALELELPGERSAIRGSGRVVWTGREDDDPGPRRCALLFRAFRGPEDRARLCRYLGSGEADRAA